MPHPVTCTDPLSPVAMCCWSSLCLTSVWHLMDSWPTIPASIVALRYQLSTQKPIRGLSPLNLQSNLQHPNVLPLLCSHLSPPPNMCPLLPLNLMWESHQSSLREAVDRAPLCSVLQPVKETELSRPASVPVNLVSSLAGLHKQQVTNYEPMLCSDWAFLFLVITGKVTSLTPAPRGTLIVNLSLIKPYKTGRLTITQVEETMSVKLVLQCRKCPLLRRGLYHSRRTHTHNSLDH